MYFSGSSIYNVPYINIITSENNSIKVTNDIINGISSFKDKRNMFTKILYLRSYLIYSSILETIPITKIN